MEGLKEALQYTANLARENEKTEVLEICGKTYANRNLPGMIRFSKQSR